jgi:hypothetical protein
MKRIGMIAMLGMLAIPGIANAGMCADQACVDKAFTKFEVSVLKGNGAYLNSVNKAFAVYAATGDDAKTTSLMNAAGVKFNRVLATAEAKFEAKTGLDITGAELATTVYLADQDTFLFATGQIGGFGY